MQDASKIAKLRKVLYTIAPTCVLCQHGEFSGTMWGRCQRHRYKHAKHTTPQKLGIHASGVCGSHKWRDDVEQLTATYDEFR